ncbi:Quinoprotein glucose dehydrogenase B precursor [Planctomycetes bacterium Poly30]|uniref:Quinoprotein glucose dehydrogenase B n=1 Tax=Saltatorellus ferox TaxID=2528018 RepID=A0A518ERP4_9BACT|nr:Quinoprotein glucose dehydrogenase B precursor [Planctomycetes bacterium Poly30]
MSHLQSAVLAASFLVGASAWGLAPPAVASDLPAGFQESIVLEGLASPSALDFTPDGRLMVTERVAGYLRLAEETPTGTWRLLPEPFARFDIPKENGAPAAHRSSGVRGFAFDPDYASNGFVYVFYMKDNPRQNRVVRIQRDPANPDRALPGETLLLNLPFNGSSASGSHNGGALRFGPDGLLYITTGDGWSGGDGVQSLSTFTGKVLRIRPDGSIPESNPFYGQASGDYRAIYALGLRNPYTLTLNESNGWMLIGEANGGNKAEILRLEPGANYRHQNFGGIGLSRGHWVDGGAAGNKMVAGGAWYPASGPFPSQYHGAYFMALWGTNGANGGPPGQLSYVRSAADPSVVAFDTNVGLFDGAGTRLKPVHLRVGPDGALYYLMTSYLTGAGSIVRVRYEGTASVATPTFTPDGGSYPGPIQVALSTATAGAEIRWTADGSEPTMASTLYTGPLSVRRTGTLRSRAFLGGASSSLAAADYTIGAATNQPPVVNAGPDQFAEVRTMVVLNGAATYDPDGSELLLSENWVQVSGPRAELSNTDETAAYFFPVRTGRYRFRLDVTDGTDSRSDFTVVTVLPCIHDVQESLVARWSMEEGSGLVALDRAAGLWNGTLAGATWSSEGVASHTPGTTSGALSFDGIDDRLFIGSPDVTGTEITLTAWIRADDFGVPDARILSKATGVSEQDHYWMLSTIQVSGAPRLRFRLKAGGLTSTLISTGPPLAAAEWTFVAATYDGARMRMYLDGTEVGSMAKSGAISTSPSVPAAIGNQPASDRPFDGLIDEVRIYSRALDARELDIVAGEGRRLDCSQAVDPK